MLLEKALEVNTTIALANLSLAGLGYDFKNKQLSPISGAVPVDAILVPICPRQHLSTLDWVNGCAMYGVRGLCSIIGPGRQGCQTNRHEPYIIVCVCGMGIRFPLVPSPPPS